MVVKKFINNSINFLGLDNFEKSSKKIYKKSLKKTKP